MTTGKISKIAGPLVVATGMREANMFDVVRVSDSKLIGEIIEMHGDRASIQVYEETSGLGTGEPVESTGEPLSVELMIATVSQNDDSVLDRMHVQSDAVVINQGSPFQWQEFRQDDHLIRCLLYTSPSPRD